MLNDVNIILQNFKTNQQNLLPKRVNNLVYLLQFNHQRHTVCHAPTSSRKGWRRGKHGGKGHVEET